MCFGCSKEPSHQDGSFEYPQHMFWLRNKNNNFLLRTLTWRPVCAHRKLMSSVMDGHSMGSQSDQSLMGSLWVASLISLSSTQGRN